MLWSKFLFSCFFISFLCFFVTAQVVPQQNVEINAGTYKLIQLLENIKKQGVSISFSSDKIPDTTIHLQKEKLVLDILKLLKKKKIVEYKLQNGYFIVSQYKPRFFILSGILKDAESGESIIDANVVISNKSIGTNSNGYGFFTLALLEGTYDIQIRHIQYVTKKITIDLNINTKANWILQPKVQILEDITVVSENTDVQFLTDVPSLQKISINGDAIIPFFMGEVDVNQKMLLLPGIRSIGEDANGLYVRGGNIDQNLFVLDEATIYNPNHFYGLISVFNPEAVKEVSVYKGYIPPAYGGRLASVISVRQKDGDISEKKLSGGIGLLSSRLLIEGPIRDRVTFVVSGRRNLFNLSALGLGGIDVERNKFRFWDFNSKVNITFNSKNRLYLFGYVGSDKIATNLSSFGNWGNNVQSIRWNYISSPKLFTNISLIRSEYLYRNENTDELGGFIGRSSIQDYELKADFDYSPSVNNNLNFGIKSTLHFFRPASRESLSTTLEEVISILDEEKAVETGIYLEHITNFNRFKLNYGLRFSLFNVLGASTVFIYEDNASKSESTIIDTLNFKQNQLVTTYGNLEPRVALSYQMDNNTSIKFAYSKTAQYVHLINNTISPQPTDIWKSSDPYIAPKVAEKLSIGYFVQSKRWDFSAELYFNQTKNDFQYKNGADLLFNQHIETELTFTQSRAYGLELYLKKRIGKLTGWISYHLSRTESKILNDVFATWELKNYDKTHDVSTTWSYKASNRLSFSLNFIYNTGIPFVIPTEKYIFDNILVPHFESNTYTRLPHYHRLDLAIQLKNKIIKKNGEQKKIAGSWTFSVFNVYARKNIYSYFFQESRSQPGLGEFIPYSIFNSFVPSITYNFKL